MAGRCRRHDHSCRKRSRCRCVREPHRAQRSCASARESDTLDSERIAREVLAHSLLPKAFKRAGQDHGPDERYQLIAIWHNRRQSIRARAGSCRLEAAIYHVLPETARLPVSGADGRPLLRRPRRANAATVPDRRRIGEPAIPAVGRGALRGGYFSAHRALGRGGGRAGRGRVRARSLLVRGRWRRR